MQEAKRTKKAKPMTDSKAAPRRWFYPLLVLIVAGLIGFFYVATPEPGQNPPSAPAGADPAGPSDSAVSNQAAEPKLNIPLDQTPGSKPASRAKPRQNSASSQGSAKDADEVDVAATELEELGESAENLEKFTTLENSGLERLTIDGMYVGEFTYSEQRCKLEADLRINYVKASGKPPRGRWEYLVTCNDQIKVSGSGIEALESHMRLAGGGQWLLANPSRPMNILEFTLVSPNEIDFTVYEMYDGKYRRNGSGLAYNTEAPAP